MFVYNVTLEYYIQIFLIYQMNHVMLFTVI